MICVNCGRESEAPIIAKHGIFCSKVCRNRNNCKRFYRRYHEQQKARTLKNYHKYVSTDEGHKKIREINKRAVAKKRFGVKDRTEILSRFGFMCVYCLKRGNTKTLAIHHIDHRGRNTKTPNNDPKNLVSVCPSCHSEIHFHKRKLKPKI